MYAAGCIASSGLANVGKEAGPPDQPSTDKIVTAIYAVLLCRVGAGATDKIVAAIYAVDPAAPGINFTEHCECVACVHPNRSVVAYTRRRKIIHHDPEMMLMLVQNDELQLHAVRFNVLLD